MFPITFYKRIQQVSMFTLCNIWEKSKIAYIKWNYYKVPPGQIFFFFNMYYLYPFKPPYTTTYHQLPVLVICKGHFIIPAKTSVLFFRVFSFEVLSFAFNVASFCGCWYLSTFCYIAPQSVMTKNNLIVSNWITQIIHLSFRCRRLWSCKSSGI